MAYLTAFLAAVIIPYILGSLSFAILVVKILYKKDIRTFGSGNAGMTNVLRTFGKGAAILTITGDIGKGVAAVLLCKWIFASYTPWEPTYGACIACVFAVLGHLFPLFFKFKGGKGVSVAIGAVLAIEPILAIALFVIFVTVFLASKIVSLSSIIGAFSYPIMTMLYAIYIGRDVLTSTILAILPAALVIIMHKDNIKRLIAGTEYRFDQKKDK